MQYCGAGSSEGHNEGKRRALGTQQNVRLFPRGGGLPRVPAKVSVSPG